MNPHLYHLDQSGVRKRVIRIVCFLTHTRDHLSLSFSSPTHVEQVCDSSFLPWDSLSPIRLSPKLRVAAATLSLPVHGGATLLLPSSSMVAAARGSVARERGDCGTPFFFNDDLLLPPECRLPSNGPPPFFVIGHRGSSFLHGTAPSSSMMARAAHEIHEGGAAEGGPRRRWQAWI
jgi:hypothetical protein